MRDVLLAFVDQLRAAGLPVSMVEAIDAANAVAVTGLADRGLLRATLGATLVKNVRHHEAFETTFEVFFGMGSPASAPSVALATGMSGGEEDDLAAALYAALRDHDEALLAAIARRAVDRYAGMEPGRPVGGTYYLYRVLRQLDAESVMEALLGDLTGELEPLQRRLAAEDLAARAEHLRQLIRSEIRRRLVADRGVAAVARTLRRPLAEDIDLTRATRAELREVERVLHPLTRRLATRLGRRRRQRRRGRLDIRSTIRRSLSYGGIPLEPQWRTPSPSRPDLVLLCDISGSMATFARFTLQFIYAMSHQFSRVRAFAFIDALDEVTRFFAPGTDVSEAASRISSEAKVVWLDGHSDYGNALDQFSEGFLSEVTPRTVVIVTGDARSNYHDPNPQALAAIADAAKAVYWLNPEPRRYWDTGDSVMQEYSPYCRRVFEVRNLRQLERFVEEVTLPTAQPAQAVPVRGR
ncbi:MAG: VWA domain-containing protein [Acidimicrobiia bacterium]|nr:VWA domain-containing protein [Acidimicrobiia bacterium]